MNIKNYILNYLKLFSTKIEDIDLDFWEEDFYLIDLEEVYYV